MIYVAFILYLVLMLFMGVGVYRLWASLLKPAWVNWALLPGTIVSEMGYIFGCLITGGEVQRARIVPGKGESSGEPTAEATAGVKYLGPILASLMSIVACAAAVIAAHALLGEPVIKKFILAEGLLTPAVLPKAPPTSWDGLWTQLETHLHLLRRMFETLARVDWLNWRVPVFIYLSLCLAVRLSPVRRALRPTLAAVAAIALVIAGLALVWPRFGDVMGDVWPLITYLWSLLLLLLTVTLLVLGVLALVLILTAKDRAT
jgi:hypothetical protein